MLLDKPVYDAAGRHFTPYIEFDIHRSLRVVGFWPLWLVVAIAFWIVDRPLGKTRGIHAAISRGSLMALATGLSALAAEAMKLLIRRQRPTLDWNGQYLFGAFTEEWYRGTNLALPSSHTAVAFGAAFALGRLFPGTLDLWLVMACGCAATRVASRAHVLSDVVAAVPLSYVVVAALFALHVRIKRRVEGPTLGER
jgi:membrane-associated phospholipid phosphatase